MTKSSEQPIELTVEYIHLLEHGRIDTMWLGYELKENLDIQIQIISNPSIRIIP